MDPRIRSPLDSDKEQVSDLTMISITCRVERVATADPGGHVVPPAPAVVDDGRCLAFLDAVELVGRKWTAGILVAGLRVRDVSSSTGHTMPGMSDRLLTQRLRTSKRVRSSSAL